MAIELTETSILVVGLLGILTYISMQYKRLYDGTPIALVALSVTAVVLWMVELAVTERMMLLVFGLHAMTLGAMVVSDTW